MKRFFDLLVSCILIIFLLPLFVAIALLIRLNSPGPVFFIQRRIGLHGRTFKMFKFRTMVNNAENIGTGLFSYEDDPRITMIGHFLRRKSLDELPQLFNVLLGSMSLVGPRPPVTYELGPWDEYTPHMRKRFTVKPGITGLAQVSGRNDNDWDQKIYYDNIYVDNFARRGVFEDLRLLLKTVQVVFRGSDTVEQRSMCNPSVNSISFRALNAKKSSDSP